MKTLIVIALLGIFALISAQTVAPANPTPSGKRYYIAGSFSRLNSFTRPFSCFNHKSGQWTRSHAAGRNVVVGQRVFLNENEAYYFNDGQLFYFNGTVSFALFGRDGVFTLKPGANLPLVLGTVSRLLVNRAQTRLWVVGAFNRIGSRSVETSPTNGPAERVVVFDITKKNEPVLQTCPTFDTSIVNLNNFVQAWTQGNAVTFVAQVTAANPGDSTSRMLRLDCSTNTVTAVTQVQQPANQANYKQSAADESIWAYSTTGILSQQPPTPTEILYQRLDSASSVWTKVISSNPTANPSLNLHPTLWAPTGNKEVYFVYSNSAPTGTVTNSVLDAANVNNQYLYKIKETEAAPVIVNAGGRLTNAGGVSATFISMSNLITDMVYDDGAKTLLAVGSDIRYFVLGAYQSKIPDASNNKIPEDRTKYQVRMVPQVVALTAEGNFTNTLGGGFAVDGRTTFAAYGYFPTPAADLTCFAATITTYDVYAPYAAMYDETVNQWQAIPGLSRQMEADIINSDTASINAIERMYSQFGPEAFFAGKFRTINGVVYNSIVKYTLGANGVATLTDLKGGVEAYSRLGETADDDYVRYYGMKPGTVNQMVFDGVMLYVAGSFSKAGNMSVNNIARWNENTKTWSHMDGGLNGAVTHMVLLNGNVYVAGSFNFAGKTHVNRIAMFNTQTEKWESLAAGIVDATVTVTDMIAYDGKLIVATNSGTSNIAGVNSQTSIVAWNPASQTWSSVNQRIERGRLDANTCGPNPTCSVNSARLYRLGNRLYALGGGSLYAQAGDAFELVHNNYNGYAPSVYRNGLAAGTRISVFTAGPGSFYFVDDINAPTARYSVDSNNLFSDSLITVWSDASKKSFSVFALAVVAICALLFL